MQQSHNVLTLLALRSEELSLGTQGIKGKYKKGRFKLKKNYYINEYIAELKESFFSWNLV